MTLGCVASLPPEATSASGTESKFNAFLMRIQVGIANDRVRSFEAVSQPQDTIVCVPTPSRHTLPNADRAIVEIAKLRDYCLNPNHEDGKHKARVFACALGIRQSDAEWLREILLVAARNEDATAAGKNRFGTLYVLDSTVTTSIGSAVVRSGWIVQFTEGFPRLTTCYAKKRVSL